MILTINDKDTTDGTSINVLILKKKNENILFLGLTSSLTPAESSAKAYNPIRNARGGHRPVGGGGDGELG